MLELRAIAVAAIASLSLLMPSAGATAEEKPLNVPAPTPAKPPAPAAAPDTTAPPATTGTPAAGAASAWSAEVAPAKAGQGMTLDARQTELVHKVSGYFSDLNTLQGSFVQTSGDNKRMKG